LIIDADKGHVLTNDHVIDGATQVVVILPNGRERPVSQIRRDPKSDLALLTIEPKSLTQADWGDSDALDTGDWVLAIGQPFGLSGTVTAGIVSGKGRGIGVTMYEDLIQTDAAINPGNSGGPLVNLKGQVVGINTALKTIRGGFEGFGFAVPAARARRVAADLAQFGSVRRAFLGISIGPVDPAAIDRIEQSGAVAVNDVGPGTPAEKAGLKPGDVILRLRNQPVQGPGSLQSAIEFAPVGEPVTVTVDRAGERLEISVRPEAQPQDFGLPQPGPAQSRGAPAEPPSTGRERHPERDRDRDREPAGGEQPGRSDAANSENFRELGLRLSVPDPALARRFNLRDASRGLVVTGVEPDGPADRGGLEIGMVITDAANHHVSSLADFREALTNRPKDRDLLVRILRGGKAEFRVILDKTDRETAPAKGNVRNDEPLGDVPSPSQPRINR
jgi:serine protease Do